MDTTQDVINLIKQQRYLSAPQHGTFFESNTTFDTLVRPITTKRATGSSHYGNQDSHWYSPQFVIAVTPFYLFKKVWSRTFDRGRIAVLRVDPTAVIFMSEQAVDGSSARSRKVRVNTATVVGVYEPYDDRAPVFKLREYAVGHSAYDSSFEYRKGRVVTPIEPYSMLPLMCESGIHAFASYEEADRYTF